MEVPYRGTASDSRILGASLIPYTSELLHEPVYFFLFTTLKLISDNYSKKYIRKHFFFCLMKRLWEEKTMYTLLGMLSLRRWEHTSTDVQGRLSRAWYPGE